MERFSMALEKMARQQEFILWANRIMLDIGMTQKELAQKIGCDYNYLSNILGLRAGISGSKWNAAIKAALLEAQKDNANKAVSAV